MIGGGMNKLFRRQFVIGEIRTKGVLKDFKKENLGNFSIYAQRDLPLTRIDFEDKTLFLLGYLINPRNHRASDRKFYQKF